MNLSTRWPSLQRLILSLVTALVSLASSGSAAAALPEPGVQVDLALLITDDEQSMGNLLRESMRREAGRYPGLQLNLYDIKVQTHEDYRQTRDKLLSGLNVGPHHYYVTVPFDKQEGQQYLNLVEQGGGTVIFLMRDPGVTNLATSNCAWLIGVNRRLPAIHQVELLQEYLQRHQRWDRNGNGRLDYLLLKGMKDSDDTTIRTRTVKNQLATHGIDAQVLRESFCNWDAMQAYERVKGLLDSGEQDNLEAVICNNDAMAIGALRALQEHGFNTRPESVSPAGSYVPVLGVDGSDEALRLIAEGYLCGTSLQDHNQYAEVTLAFIDSLERGIPFDAQQWGVEIGDAGQIILPFIKIGQREAAVLHGHEQ